MTSLKEKKCEACRADAPPATDEERVRFLKEIPSWKIEVVDGVDRLTRVFSFPDFAGALTFTNQVAEIAEEAGHHPLLITEWGRCTVSWWSHEMGGLHLNDFILAARTDALI
ncbi:MAG: 4a-hydroxytetrahydrobiopterin dehydratase [Verrucomicrobiota bacterium]